MFRSRGFGFVTFDNDGAVDGCQEARPHTIDGKMVRIQSSETCRTEKGAWVWPPKKTDLVSP